MIPLSSDLYVISVFVPYNNTWFYSKCFPKGEKKKKKEENIKIIRAWSQTCSLSVVTFKNSLQNKLLF